MSSKPITIAAEVPQELAQSLRETSESRVRSPLGSCVKLKSGSAEPEAVFWVIDSSQFEMQTALTLRATLANASFYSDLSDPALAYGYSRATDHGGDRALQSLIERIKTIATNMHSLN